MDISNTPSTTDDQELAKVLESMNEQTDTPPADDQTAPTTPVTETPPQTVTPGDPALSLDEETLPPYLSDTQQPTPPEPVDTATPALEPTPPPATPAAATPAPVSTAPELEIIKRNALEELRPLVDKLDLPADERFDTLLLLIRSTDDKSLVAAAHDAAQQITDDTKRAQALLDVIKEIDYFSGQTPQP